MKHAVGIILILTGLVSCTSAEMKELDSSEAMEAKASNYCGVVKGYDMDSKTLVECKEHYMQGLMDAAKEKP